VNDLVFYTGAHQPHWLWRAGFPLFVSHRQPTGEIAAIAGRGIRLHGFGVKTGGLHLYGHRLASADSMAWSYAARRQPPLPGCAGHRNCANCLAYAARWRARILAAHAARGRQLTLFDDQEAA
jgi:hypothetical protein